MNYRIYLKGDRKIDINDKQYDSIQQLLTGEKYTKFVRISSTGEIINTDTILNISPYNPPKNYSV